MSRHHRAQQWTTHSPKFRAQIKPLLPLPCIECGHPVLPEHKWEVGHKRDASRGGRPRLDNVGPVHCKSIDKAGNIIWPRNCNQIAGGKLGAAVTNGRRRQAQDIRPW